MGFVVQDDDAGVVGAEARVGPAGERESSGRSVQPATAATHQVGREAVWKNVVMQAGGAPLDPQGFAIASRLYQRCGAAVDSRTASALGVCLEQAQQDFVNAMEFELQGRSAAGPTLDAGAGGS
jgi:hypothetical protein